MFKVDRPAARLMALAMVLSGVLLPARPAVASPSLPARAPEPLTTRAQSDYNGDGFADLAVGGSTYRPKANLPTGTISVIYGSADGLVARRNGLISADDFPGRQLESFGASLATGDFDADGYADLAVGVLPGGGDPQPHTGEVRVIYGSAAGLTTARSEVWSPDSPGVPGSSAPDDGFGAELAVGNFGHGDQDDLATGAGEWSDGRGKVTVLYGSAGGLTAAGSQAWTQSSPGIPGRAAPEENFGGALAAGNFTGGAYDDLAIGVPRDGAVDGESGPGAVNVLRGSAAGLTSQGAQRWSQASPGVKGQALPGEAFGQTLAAGHFTGRATADLAVGVPSDTAVGDYRGAVNVLYGSSAGLSGAGNQIFTRRTRGLADAHQLDSFLGSTVVAGNFGRNVGSRTHDDLAVFAHNDFNRDGVGYSRGVVEVLYGTDRGLSTRHSQSWDWRTSGVKGRGASNENSDAYGSSMAAADFGRTSSGARSRGVPPGGGFDDLASADVLADGPDEDHYGAVSVLYGTSSGLTGRRDQLWTVRPLRRSEPRFFGETLPNPGRS